MEIERSGMEVVEDRPQHELSKDVCSQNEANDTSENAGNRLDDGNDEAFEEGFDRVADSIYHP